MFGCVKKGWNLESAYLPLLIIYHCVGGEDAKHRYLRPHRLWQDDANGARSLLHGANIRHPRGEGQGRGGRHHGQHGAGEAARDHHPVGGDLHPLGRLQRQHHRYTGPRRLYH